jgi:hypothetical protein
MSLQHSVPLHLKTSKYLIFFCHKSNFHKVMSTTWMQIWNLTLQKYKIVIQNIDVTIIFKNINYNHNIFILS